MLHLHHMLPKHSSYFHYLGNVKEDDYYKVYLTPEGHADQHDILYRVFGDKFDKIASDGLRGQKNIKPQVFSEAGKRGGKATRAKQPPFQGFSVKGCAMPALTRWHART